MVCCSALVNLEGIIECFGFSWLLFDRLVGGYMEDDNTRYNVAAYLVRLCDASLMQGVVWYVIAAVLQSW